MKKQSSKMVITGLLLVVISLFMMFQPLFTWALEQEDLRGCAFEVDPTDYLFQLGNMNPGDTYQGTVTVTKTGPSRGDIYFSWLYVSGNPPYPGENNLFEQLWLVIKQGDLVLYEGPMVGGSTPDEPLAIEDFEYLISMNQGDVVLLDFFVTLPGSTTGNLYQGAELETELIFVSVCSDSSRPAIDIEKATNGEDADLPTGPNISVGGVVTWTYVVTNTGNVPLRDIVVTDNRTGVNPVYISGDTNEDEILQVGEVWTYQAIGVAVEGQYANIGSVVGTPPSGPNVTDSDPSHYIGVIPDETEIIIEKYTNGEDADLPTGPQIVVGGNVTWTYVVSNPNTIPLFNVVVTDNRAGVVPVYISGDVNGDNVLQPVEVWIYRATGIAAAGQYANVGTASGATARGKVVTDSDPSHYFGVSPTTPTPPTTPPAPPVPPVVPPTPVPPTPEPDPDQTETEPELPEIQPPQDEDQPEVIVVRPEGPQASPPLPRTDGMSMSIFLIGFVFIAAGVLLKKGSEDKKGRSMQI
jgi:hypothetical protein